MDLETWLPMYDEICDEFGFDKRLDAESADILASILQGRGEAGLASVRSNFPRSVTVCGGSQALGDEISSMQVEGYLVAADSATSVLLEAGVEPNMIVTDLDGIVEDQIELNRKGVAVFVHAHGDNRPALERYVPLFAGTIVGTCQCPPPKGLHNFGGFTDGDRAACICVALGARDIQLVGFDFENPSEKAGKRRDVKKRKLLWAKKIIDEISREGVRIKSAKAGPDAL